MIRKLDIESIRRSLVNKETTFCELDDLMISWNFYSNYDEDARILEAKAEERIYYLWSSDNETQIVIDFIITADNEEDEGQEVFDLIPYSVKEVK